MTVLRFRTTEQSIDKNSHVQQILWSDDEIGVALRVRGYIARHCIRPLDRNKTPASVGTKKEEKQDSVLSANLLQNFNRSALECVRFARDPDRGRKLSEVGSVSGSPSARFPMPS